ncbi:methyltransferase family protein [Rhizobium sp. RAF56]|jgi:protein-S-isoprenylcysteine O-methyltransferase Ste14|uniref:methyltransferase family protein n=1 Tax=Rhizobium sp. RAF56 TaxID=3233062 RepID=UPI003F96FE75
MNAFRAKPLTFPWPPLFYGLAILTALVLDRVSPLPCICGPMTWIAGGLLAMGSILLGLWTAKTLVESETVITYRRATHLVTRGPFRYTRNPTYLCYTLLTVTFGLVTGNLWFFAAAAAAAAVTTAVVIHREEMHLLSRFGFEFEHYCKRTRRWV